MDYQATYELWAQRLAGSDYQSELAVYRDDEAARQEAFYRDMEFGTAGMRGVFGLGPNTMNRFTVARASQGLADYLREQHLQQAGVAIAYDSRHRSAEFAKITALTLAANGVKAYLYDRLTSVPQLSFAVLQLGCAAGVVITASHNPAKYNGYKVYGADGGQLTDHGAAAVMAHITAVADIFAIPQMDEEHAIAAGLLQYIGDEIYEQYYRKVLDLCPEKQLLASQGGVMNIVYTPLHGTGREPVMEVLRRLGVELHIVPEQELPDGHFPTVSAPNPEDPAAFALARQLADKCGADLLIATDPDCDRMGLAVRGHDGQFITLTGNQIGCLLLDYLLRRVKRQGGEFVVKSLVSTPLADAIAARHGVELRAVLTGFKYIAEQINISVASGQGRFLFGFEESYGYLAGDFVRDKDACIASMLAVSAACYYAERGLNLYDALLALEVEYGCYAEKVISYTREGKAGLELIAGVMTKLRQHPLIAMGGLNVLQSVDYLDSAATGLPAANVLLYRFEQASLILRPSGTEPKLRVYLAASGSDAEQANQRYALLKQNVTEMLDSMLG